MAIKGIMRAGSVQLRVKEMGPAVRHYTEVLGLIKSHEGNDGRVYLKAWDEHDHHSVVLREAETAGMDHMAFKVSDNDALLGNPKPRRSRANLRPRSRSASVD